MPKHSEAAIAGYLINIDGIPGEELETGPMGSQYTWQPVMEPASIKLGYPVQASELTYQLDIAIWKAGRGPFSGRE